MIILILKGIIIGFFMLFPGLSGGSIAIILNEYNRIIYHTSNIFKSFKNSITYLFFIGLGGIIGLYLSSKIIVYFSEKYYQLILYFFFGIMIAFISNFLYEKTAGKIRLVDIIYLVFGIIISLLFTYIPKEFFSLNSIFGMFFLGLLLAIALILPGISFSYVLLIFSCYDDVIMAITTFDFLFLFKIGIFLVTGIILTIRIIEKSLVKFEKETSLIISGFMISSVVSIFKFPVNVIEINYMTIFLMIGILFFLIFGKIIKK